MRLLKDYFAQLALACVLISAVGTSTGLASAASRFDGSWGLSFVTRAGDCDPSYNFNVNITHGIITHPNLLKFRGNVTSNGRTRASVSVGSKYASGAGRLSQLSGGGRWVGHSGTSRCSGVWTAQRF